MHTVNTHRTMVKVAQNPKRPELYDAKLMNVLLPRRCVFVRESFLVRFPAIFFVSPPPTPPSTSILLYNYFGVFDLPPESHKRTQYI